MGFGSIVAQMVEPVPTGAKLKDLVAGRYGRKQRVEPPTEETLYLRASSLATMCARKAVLCGIHKVDDVREDNVDTLYNFDIGSGMHYAMQNLVLPIVGVIRGCWRCACGRRYGKQEAGRPWISFAIARPEECPCGYPEMTYEEYTVRDAEHCTGGHMDGLLEVPERPDLGVLEIKSIGANGARKVKEAPQLDHVVQIQTYLWLTGLKWGRVLYLDKSVFGWDKGAVEHHIERDEEMIEGVKSLLMSVKRGLSLQILPDKVCAHRGCERAQACCVLEECFGKREPDASVGLF